MLLTGSLQLKACLSSPCLIRVGRVVCVDVQCERCDKWMCRRVLHTFVMLSGPITRTSLVSVTR